MLLQLSLRDANHSALESTDIYHMRHANMQTGHVLPCLREELKFDVKLTIFEEFSACISSEKGLKGVVAEVMCGSSSYVAFSREPFRLYIYIQETPHFCVLTKPKTVKIRKHLRVSKPYLLSLCSIMQILSLSLCFEPNNILISKVNHFGRRIIGRFGWLSRCFTTLIYNRTGHQNV